jgi:alkanesulfonate monooxygenase SsuD/methylene tetrahydromethanopterin reductase-like flavin-dependent oxidoreductase (luciferase family)
LTAIAAVVPRIAIGPMVLNVANRDAGTLAVMAATLQEVSGGRLLLGLGAGGGAGTPYPAEQRGLGRTVPGDIARRRAVEDAVGTLHTVWSGTAGGAAGYLRPDPPPPVIIGGFGPKMAELAGRVGDGINAPAGRLSELAAIAREAHGRSGRDPSAFLVTTSIGPSPRELARLAEVGVDHAVVLVRPPYTDGIALARDVVAAAG